MLRPKSFWAWGFGGVNAQCVKVCGGKIRPEVGPVSPDGAVFHESILEKHLLAGQDIFPGEEGFPLSGDDFLPESVERRGRQGPPPGSGLQTLPERR